MRKHIRILNPLDGPGFTSRQRAKRFVAAGIACWHKYGECIRFLRSGDHQTKSAQRSIDRTAWAYERAASTGLATLDALANTPMIAPAVVLGFGKRKGASRYTFLATQGL